MHSRLEIPFVCPRNVIAALLFSFFCLAYIAAPYWQISPSMANQVLLLSILSAGLWAWFSSTDVCFKISQRQILIFFFCLIVMGLLNHRTVSAVIPWKGDEDYHIVMVRKLLHKPQLLHIYFFLVILFVYGAWRRSKWSLAIAVLLVVYSIFWGISLSFQSAILLRYPFVSRYFQAILPAILSYWNLSFYEISYRLIPFLFSVVAAWLCFPKTGLSNRWEALLLVFAICSMPLLYYYTSILYLEMPAIALMLAATVEMKYLLTEDFVDIRRKPQWLALVLIGFIKETTSTFLFAYIFCRFIVRMFFKTGFNPIVVKNSKCKHFLINEVSTQFCVLLPLMIYLCYRLFFGVRRKFDPSFANLSDFQIYTVFFQSLLDQFGFFSFLFLPGMIAILRKRDFPLFFFISVAFALTFMFIATDSISYIGYSRFNLLFLPIILIPALNSIQVLSKEHTKVAIILLCGTIAFNLIKSPINLDGTKKPLWGNYLCDTSEHYYPYRDVLNWLKDGEKTTSVFFAGVSYPYFFEFYFNQMRWRPLYVVQKSSGTENQNHTLREAFESADNNQCKTVVYHVPHHATILQQGDHGYALVKVFRNQAHALAVYGR